MITKTQWFFHELAVGDEFIGLDPISRGRRFKRIQGRSQFLNLAQDEQGMEWVFNPNTLVNRVDKGGVS